MIEGKDDVVEDDRQNSLALLNTVLCPVHIMMKTFNQLLGHKYGFPKYQNNDWKPLYPAFRSDLERFQY
jgi:hypothetical protein